MSRNERKYNKLFRDLNFYRGEVEYQDELLPELHAEFDLYYHKFCSERGIDFKKLKEEQAHNEENLSNIGCGSFEKAEKEEVPKVFSKIYKSIATKLHPDKFPHLTEVEQEAKAEAFKKLNLFFENQDWANLLAMAKQEGVNFLISNELIAFMKKEVNCLKSQIKSNQARYSWKFYDCDDAEDCKDELIKQFLKQVHNLEAT